MTAATATERPAIASTQRGRSANRLTVLATLVRRRAALTVRTPREILVPLLTPILFALVIAPALAKTVGNFRLGLDYMTFVALATAGLLVPINMMFSGVGVLVDRDSGARPDILAAPLERPLIVIANLIVAFALTGLQLAVLVVAAILRGADFQAGITGVLWFVGGAGLLGIGMYGVAEALANRAPSVEEYIGAVPAISIVPWFFAGTLFTISSLPAWLTGFAKVLPLTHALALMRYGLLDKQGTGLHDIWGMSNPTAMAFLSLAVVAVFAVVLTVVSVRTFARAAVR